MNRWGAGLAIAAGLLLSGCATLSARLAPPHRPSALAWAYPDQVKAVRGGQVVMVDGAVFPISDGRPGEASEQGLDQADIADMFAQTYRRGPQRKPPRGDPGRARYEPLFLKMYGDCSTRPFQAHMRRVAWMPARQGGTVNVTTVNGVDRALEAVVADLEKLPPEMTRYLVPTAGAFNCRVVAGTGRRSMHAYGAAIDIATAWSDYWLWKGGEDAVWANRIPPEIVAVFERHGFIWGGRWRHFDTMHFEYRPELLPRRRRP
ncbi:M15 family metallopeptidase [Phenylobacterium sp.]|uniref:M15 family metallopeptidase n=1 Tax=Phenylobacterium sp. TaxID=1871053 RepID=UPI003BAA6F6F